MNIVQIREYLAKTDPLVAAQQHPEMAQELAARLERAENALEILMLLFTRIKEDCNMGLRKINAQ